MKKTNLILLFLFLFFTSIVFSSTIDITYDGGITDNNTGLILENNLVTGFTSAGIGSTFLYTQVPLENDVPLVLEISSGYNNYVHRTFIWIPDTVDTQDIHDLREYGFINGINNTFGFTSAHLAIGSGTTYISLDTILNDTYFLTNTSIFNIVYEEFNYRTDFSLQLFFNNLSVQNYSGISNVDRIFNFTEQVLFNRIILTTTVSSTGLNTFITLQGYTFFNISSATDNQLPFFNVSLNNNILCINQSEDVVFILNWSVFDNEEDIIYYSTDEIETKNFNVSVRYSIRECNFLFGCSFTKDFNFLQNVFYPSSNTCRINELEDVNISQFNLVQRNEEDYYLQLTTTCSESDKSYNYRFDNIIERLFYFTEFEGLDNNESFNLTFFNDDLTQSIYQLVFTVDNGNITIESVNETGLEFKANTVYDNDLLQFSLRHFTVGVLLFTMFEPDPTGIIFNVTRLSNESIKYVTITLRDNIVFYQKEFIVSGVAQTLLFDTVQIHNFTQNRVGVFTSNVFVSDSVHQPDNFERQTLIYNVVSCDMYVPRIEDTPTLRLRTAFNVIRDTIQAVCRPLDNIFGFDQFGTCFIVTAIYFGFTFVFSLFFGFLLGRLIMSFTLGYVSFSTIYFVFGVLGTYFFSASPSFYILFALLEVVAVIMIIRMIFVGHTGGVTNG